MQLTDRFPRRNSVLKTDVFREFLHGDKETRRLDKQTSKRRIRFIRNSSKQFRAEWEPNETNETVFPAEVKARNERSVILMNNRP